MLSSAGEPPTVDFCPNSQNHKIEKHHENIKIEWIEPKFSDNVNVTEVAKTNVTKTHKFYIVFFNEILITMLFCYNNKFRFLAPILDWEVIK